MFNSINIQLGLYKSIHAFHSFSIITVVLIVKMSTKSRIYTNGIKCKWYTAYKTEQ